MKRRNEQVLAPLHANAREEGEPLQGEPHGPWAAVSPLGVVRRLYRKTDLHGGPPLHALHVGT